MTTAQAAQQTAPRRFKAQAPSRIASDARAYAVLNAEIGDALRSGDATRLVDFAKHQTTVGAVFIDEIGCVGGEALTAEVISILAAVAADKTPLGLRAESLIATVAHRRADFRAGDLAHEFTGE